MFTGVLLFILKSETFGDKKLVKKFNEQVVAYLGIRLEDHIYVPVLVSYKNMFCFRAKEIDCRPFLTKMKVNVRIFVRCRRL